MGEIIQFPTDVRSIESVIRKILEDQGCSQKAIDWIWGDMHPRIKEFSLDRSFRGPPGSEALMKDMEDFAREIANRALLEVLKLEIELYRALEGDITA